MATQRIYSGQEAQERLRLLPEKAQSYLYSPEMIKALEDIGEQYKLHLNQVGTLEAEINSVLLGFTEPNDFVGILAESLELPEEQALALAGTVDEKVFQRVRALIRDSIQDSVPTGVTNGLREPTASGMGVSDNPSFPGKQVGEVVVPSASTATRDTVSLADIALAEPTQSTLKTVDVTPPPPTSPLRKEYAVDPYREPVE